MRLVVELDEVLACGGLDVAPRHLGQRRGVQRAERDVLETGRRSPPCPWGSGSRGRGCRRAFRAAFPQRVGRRRGGVQVAVAAEEGRAGVVARRAAQRVGELLAVDDRRGRGHRRAHALEGGVEHARPYRAVRRQPRGRPLGHHPRLLPVHLPAALPGSLARAARRARARRARSGRPRGSVRTSSWRVRPSRSCAVRRSSSRPCILRP